MDTQNNNELDLNIIQDRMRDNYGTAVEDNSAKATDERLKEMNKKLPSWNLEPPMKFLK